MISVDEALALVLALAAKPEPENVSLDQALGRILLEPVKARLTQPPFDASAMDGYAIRDIDIERPLTVIGEASAGRAWSGTSSEGTAIRIFTGAPVPEGYDRVIMQENVTREGDVIRITDSKGGSNIRPKGNDFASGDQIAAGRRISAADIGLFAAMNVPQVTVARRPTIAVIAGGDELVRPGEVPNASQIISSNDLAIAALARDAGAIPHILPIARDTEDSLRESFRQAAGSDLIVTIGGASVGDHDLVGKVAADLGMERSFYRLAMRPGKPLMAGKMAGSAMLGLPGNPVSAIVCGILFMQPLIYAMQGLSVTNGYRKARLAADLPAEGDRQHYLRAVLAEGKDLPRITAFDDQDSARLSLLSKADALLVRPAHDPERKAGEIVSYIPLA